MAVLLFPLNTPASQCDLCLVEITNQFLPAGQNETKKSHFFLSFSAVNSLVFRNWFALEKLEPPLASWLAETVSPQLGPSV